MRTKPVGGTLSRRRKEKKKKKNGKQKLLTLQRKTRPPPPWPLLREVLVVRARPVVFCAARREE
jgi:hypothetical protein